MAKQRKTSANTAQKAQNTPQTPQSSWGQLATKLNGLVSQYGFENFIGAFGRAGGYWANQPQIQNARVKAISTLPADYTKEQLGEFLIAPYQSERELRQIGETLKYSNYSMFKIPKTYADIPTYSYFAYPKYVEEDEVQSEGFKRAYRLIDKFNKRLQPDRVAHDAAAKCGTQGKIFLYPRYVIDKAHNDVQSAMCQQLPEDYVTIVGFNNISRLTVSYNLMYFLTPGTDYRQFGDLFEPYMDDFLSIVSAPSKKSDHFVYASKKPNQFEINADGLNRLRKNDVQPPFQQNGRWYYWVTLPINKIFPFELDSSTVAVVSPFTGLYQTFNQQADYEASQFALITLPLIKIFTGEIPYYGKNDAASTEDRFAMSDSMLQLFTTLFTNLMLSNNTGGTAFYGAPFENIKSHDFPAAAGASTVSAEFQKYGVSKTGLQALIPIVDSPNMNVGQYSSKVEGHFMDEIYRCTERMMNYIYESLNLDYDFEFVMFGDQFSKDTIRADAMKAIDKGDISAYYILAALDRQSILDKEAMQRAVKATSILDNLTVPPTSFTQSGNSKNQSPTGGDRGAPSKTEVEIEETAREKETITETE